VTRGRSSELSFEEVASLAYERPDIARGYAGQTLAVDLSRGAIDITPLAEEVKRIFIGGKGLDLWLLWNAVNGDTAWNDPENAVCIASGPLGGTPNYPGSGKSIVTTLSPLTSTVIDSNVGGHFGPFLKFSGFDALCITGKAAEDTVVLVDGVRGVVEVLRAKGLPATAYDLSQQLSEHFGEDDPGSVSVVTTGPGAANSLLGCLDFTWYDAKRGRPRYKQAGRGGTGTVFADKGLRAVVARFGKVSQALNDPADAAALKDVAKLHREEIHQLDPVQNRMRQVGTTHIVDIMNDFDLLPTHNFRFGHHPEGLNLGQDVYDRLFDKGFDGCWIGCAVACSHGVKSFVPLTGPYAGREVFVDGPEYETIAGCGSNLGIFDPHTVLEINFYCDAYGIDTISFGTGLAFAMECFELGLIDERATGGFALRFGNRLAALEVLHQVARGEGFGALVGQGVRRMKEIFAREFGADPQVMADIGMEAKGLEFSEYVSKESLAQQGGYGLALKGPQHDEAWLIFLDMVHNLMPSFEQKAEALHWFPMFRTWFGLCGLCKLPWNDIVPEDNANTAEPAKVMQHVEWYADYFSAVTGREANPDDLIAMSEAVYNFQRIFNLRMGVCGAASDDIPYRAMGPVFPMEYEANGEKYDGELREELGDAVEEMSIEEKVAALRRRREAAYRKLKAAVYERRGWTEEGIPTLATVKRLGIDLPEVLELLAAHGVTS